MSNELAAAAVGPPNGGASQVGVDELTQGLMLVRASAIKIVRLQLAMARRDRRVVLEAVDDLVLLDRELAQFLSGIPASAETDFALERELEHERQALIREKFTLTAGTAGRIAAGWTGGDGERCAPISDADAESGAPAVPTQELAPAEAGEETARRDRSSHLIAAGLTLGLILAGLIVLALLRPDLAGGWHLEGAW